MSTSVKFGIVANPKSGAASLGRKARTLQKAADILGNDCPVAGLDTKSKEEFVQCADDLAQRVDVLVVAGGDGTFSDIINTLPLDVTLSYIPLGSGCALRYALGLPPQITTVAQRLRDGTERSLDLIACDGTARAFMASVGLEGAILHQREALQENGLRGPQAYAVATFRSLFGHLERTNTTLTVDDRTFSVPDAVTVVVTKIPYYGYGMKIVPEAEFGDGFLHLLAINSALPGLVQCLATSFITENRLGLYKKAQHIQITTQEDRYLQTDGNLYRQGRTFHFDILPRALKMWY